MAKSQSKPEIVKTPTEKLIDWIKAAAWTIALWLLLSNFVIQAYYIPSPSMENTLLVGDVLFVNKLIYGAKIPLIDAHMPKLRDPRRGDIVVFISPIEDSTLVKRLIGMAGDTIEMRQGVLYRNGEALEEAYVRSDDPEARAFPETRQEMRLLQLSHYIGPDPDNYLPDVHDWGPLVVPPDSLWMMGDNRDASRDSRFWGFVPRKNVRGTPLIIYYSWNAYSYRPLPFLTATRWRRIFTLPH